MSFFTGIKTRLLPVSSRSFHSFAGPLMEKINSIDACANEAVKLIHSTRYDIECLKKDVEESEGRLRKLESAHAAQNMLYLKEIYRLQAKLQTAEDAKRQFFRSIPNATGDLRLVQLATAKLLSALWEICKENGIVYFPWAGTLVGALSRNGSIPWDDDADVCMLEEDLQTLTAALQNSQDYQITVVYDGYVFCKQIRFSSKDPSNPCFVDIAPLYWARTCTHELDDMMKAMQSEFVMALSGRINGDLNYWSRYPVLYAPQSGNVSQNVEAHRDEQDIQHVNYVVNEFESTLSKFKSRATELGILCDREEAGALASGFEVYRDDAPHRPLLFDKDLFSPVTTTLYEGEEIPLCHNAYAFCDQVYPGWPYLADNLLEVSHFSKTELQKPKIREHLENLVADMKC